MLYFYWDFVERNDFMRNFKKQFRTVFLRKIIPVFICLSVVSFPFSAFALNTDLVDDEIYWIDKGREIHYSDDNYFEGFSKYIVDEDEGCFYLFTRFTDYRIDKESKENITFAFTIKNDANTYFFQIDKEGLINSSSKNTLNSIDVYYNFDEASCRKQGGGVYIAFKLKNDMDRTLNNFISCEYSCGLSRTYDLFDNISLDMYVPTTVKTASQKTTKQTATKSSTSSKTGRNSTKKSEVNSTKAAKESSTKFSGTGVLSSSARTAVDNSSKFSGNTKGTQSNYTGVNDDTAEYIDDYDTQIQGETVEMSSDNSESGLSRQAKLLIVIFVVLLVVGIICVIIGTVNGKKEETETENEA